MKFKTKVKGFTIMELMITMLISAIVVGITYTAYTIVSKSYLSFTAKNNDMLTIVQLDKLLKKDIISADLIVKTADGIRLEKDTAVTTYQFAPKFIIRTHLITDTFRVNVISQLTSFENKPVADTASLTDQNRLDDIALTLQLKTDKFSYHYHKVYSSDNLFKQPPYAVN